MPFTAEDFKDQYVLGGRKHDPSKNKTLFDQYANGCFSVIFSGVTDDNSAIIKADECVQRAFASAKAGEHLAATLWFNNRMVKNYPKQIKT